MQMIEQHSGADILPGHKKKLLLAAAGSWQPQPSAPRLQFQQRPEQRWQKKAAAAAGGADVQPSASVETRAIDYLDRAPFPVGNHLSRLGSVGNRGGGGIEGRPKPSPPATLCTTVDIEGEPIADPDMSAATAASGPATTLRMQEERPPGADPVGRHNVACEGSLHSAAAGGAVAMAKLGTDLCDLSLSQGTMGLSTGTAHMVVQGESAASGHAACTMVMHDNELWLASTGRRKATQAISIDTEGSSSMQLQIETCSEHVDLGLAQREFDLDDQPSPVARPYETPVTTAAGTMGPRSRQPKATVNDSGLQSPCTHRSSSSALRCRTDVHATPATDADCDAHLVPGPSGGRQLAVLTTGDAAAPFAVAQLGVLPQGVHEAQEGPTSSARRPTVKLGVRVSSPGCTSPERLEVDLPGGIASPSCTTDSTVLNRQPAVVVSILHQATSLSGAQGTPVRTAWVAAFEIEPPPAECVVRKMPKLTSNSASRGGLRHAHDESQVESGARSTNCSSAQHDTDNDTPLKPWTQSHGAATGASGTRSQALESRSSVTAACGRKIPHCYASPATADNDACATKSGSLAVAPEAGCCRPALPKAITLASEMDGVAKAARAPQSCASSAHDESAVAMAHAAALVPLMLHRKRVELSELHR
jgi:hypothetical protein